MAIFSTTPTKTTDCASVTLIDVFTSGDFKLTGFTADTATLTVYSHLAPTTTTVYDVIDDATAAAYGTLSVSGDDLVVNTSALADGVWFFEFDYTYTDGTTVSETVCVCVAIDCDLKASITELIQSKYLDAATDCDHCDADTSLPIRYPMMHHALSIAVECQYCEKAIDLYDYIAFKVDAENDCLGC
jgi:hypothetical protein